MEVTNIKGEVLQEVGHLARYLERSKPRVLPSTAYNPMKERNTFEKDVREERPEERIAVVPARSIPDLGPDHCPYRRRTTCPTLQAQQLLPFFAS